MSDTFNVSGNVFSGPAAFGSHAQAGGSRRYGAAELRRDFGTVRELIERHADDLADAGAARRAADAVGQELARPQPDRAVVRSRLDALTPHVANVAGLADVLARFGELVARFWPF